MWVSCAFIGSCFKKFGLEYQSFTDAGYMSEDYSENLANSCFIYDGEILVYRYFRNDFEEYMKLNHLSADELNNLVSLSKSLFDVSDQIELSQMVYILDSESAEKIIEIAISKVTKKSEYSMLASYILKEEYFNDSDWAEEIIKLKELL